MKVSNAVIAQSDEMGALPTLFAATQPGVEGGTLHRARTASASSAATRRS